MLLLRSYAAYLPSSPPRAVYIRVAWPRLPSYRLRGNGESEPIAARETPLPPTTSSLPTRTVCGQCLTVNCANSAELRRGQGFRRWPMSRRVERWWGAQSRLNSKPRTRVYKQIQTRYLFSTPSYCSVFGQPTLHGNHVVRPRVNTHPKGGERPLLKSRLPMLFDRIAQPSKSISFYPLFSYFVLRSIFSFSLSYIFSTVISIIVRLTIARWICIEKRDKFHSIIWVQRL